MEFITASGKTAGPVGQGTWYLGEHPSAFKEEQNTLRAGIFKSCEASPRRGGRWRWICSDIGSAAVC